MRFVHVVTVFFLGTLSLVILACGDSTQRTLQNISVSPSTADAQNYPNGQVQFTATGTYNTAPMTVTPLQASWGAVQNNAPTTGVTITSGGVAQCAAGATGVYSIGAWNVIPTKGAVCDVIGPWDNPCNSVLGTAQLTCP
ncbi:MAG TPA: hypothetical protein VK722_00760 [Candidatus Aquilonibacter sp.]|jgi:hypothetical protein|nr:hypothetical protein [Candidatus Aquilonibacter sp.]